MSYVNHRFRFSGTLLASSILCVLISAELTSPVYANSFIDDASLGGNVFFWSRDRDRKDVTTDGFEPNLRHSTFNFSADFKSGYLNEFFAVELGAFAAWELNHGGPAYPDEIGFSDANHRWDEVWSGDRSGVSLYKAQANFRLNNYWANIGYIQPAGQTILRPHWSLLPGTYQGAEIGAKYDFDNYGALEMSYLWTNRYKAPWYIHLYEFRERGAGKKIDYLHSFGFKYDFKNKWVLEAAFGQSKNYLNHYFGKMSYELPIYDNPLSMSYQFYGAKDQNHSGEDVYDGLAWLQALTFYYPIGYVGLRLEGVMVKANGAQGYFLQRMTPDYASSNGRLDMWWNARSDFNANGEKAVYAEVTYDLAGISLPGWKVGAGYAYGWGLKPKTTAGIDQSVRLVESALNLDLSYAIQNGRFKDTSFSLHYTNYDNHSNIPSWSNGFENVFQDEHDVKFLVNMPFTVF